MRIRELGRRRDGEKVNDAFALSHYPFNETSGQALDIVGGFHGNVIGTMGRTGSHYVFDGANNTSVEVGSAIPHSFINNGEDLPFTIRVSINLKNHNDAWIVSRRDAPGRGEYQFYIFSNELRFEMFQSDTSILIGRHCAASVIPLNQWVRLAITYGGDNNRSSIMMYQNAQRIDTTNRGNATYTGMEPTPSETSIGAPEFNAGFKIEAWMKDVQFDKGSAFTQNELIIDYNNAEL